MTDLESLLLQRNFCLQKNLEPFPTTGDQISGVADNFSSGLRPLNGLRHPIENQTSGWYFYAGEEFPTADDAFKPKHTEHIIDDLPEIACLLGLPPGWRFLKDGDYLDIWFDQKLLDV